MNRLLVELGGLPVGVLRRASGDTWDYRFLPEFLDLKEQERPVLGQIFLDDPGRVHRSTLKLPPFFSNLLPEGKLRTLLANLVGVNVHREAPFLAALGDDLPGAVTIRMDDFEPGESSNDPDNETAERRPTSLQRFKFSLSGVQLKFSVRRRDGRFVVPESGRGGDWIAKFPDPMFPRLPENESTIMLWARTAGIDVPETLLVPWREIENLPAELEFPEVLALAVRRFDRPQPGLRVHQEDFAQVLNLYPEGKYEKFNFETIAARCHAIAGLSAFDEVVRRLVFMVLSGNGDAHHKNWSLTYPDGRSAALSPAYDLVYTRGYLKEDRLALNLGGSKDFERVGRQTFRRLAERLDLEVPPILETVDRAAAQIRDAWREIKRESRLGFEETARLQTHLDAMHL